MSLIAFSALVRHHIDIPALSANDIAFAFLCVLANVCKCSARPVRLRQRLEMAFRSFARGCRFTPSHPCRWKSLPSSSIFQQRKPKKSHQNCFWTSKATRYLRTDYESIDLLQSISFPFYCTSATFRKTIAWNHLCRFDPTRRLNSSETRDVSRWGSPEIFAIFVESSRVELLLKLYVFAP